MNLFILLYILVMLAWLWLFVMVSVNIRRTKKLEERLAILESRFEEMFPTLS